ncbi:jg18079 [Pararge aegeria aegeria]|uniref:Jg18079 protein n=1 Tax=Pararge aegeria aegeria TaxID=348720 RepID=A0A8S4RQY0_9NEOP|nr:jg18079 [Pararge aegeria aegeria]
MPRLRVGMSVDAEKLSGLKLVRVWLLFFRCPVHAVKSISKRINNLRNEDIKFAERPPHANRVGGKKCPRPSPSRSFAELSCSRGSETGDCFRGCASEKEGFGSCVPLSESVPAFAIKSGRGGGGGAC